MAHSFREHAIPASFNRLFSQTNDKRFLRKIVLQTFLFRLAIIAIFWITDAIRILRLSPDSEQYHRLSVMIAEQMEYGEFNWPNWIDQGWYQFTALVYYLFGPYPVLIQLFNITISSATVILGFHIAKIVFQDSRIARITALLIAFFPPFIYWSCLMIKDSIAIFAIAFIALSVLKLKTQWQFHWFFYMVIGLLILLGVREYLVVVVIFLIIAAMLPFKAKNFSSSLVRLGLIILLLGIGTQSTYLGFLGLDYIGYAHYFDLDYINHIRTRMTNHGSGAMYEHGASPIWGENLMNDINMALKAIFFFFISLDLTRIGSVRQLMALPGVLLFLVLLPAFIHGAKATWKYHRNLGIVLLVFIGGILAVYGAATTNLGALYRWRMQAMPFVMAIMAYGVVLRGRGYFYNLFMRLIRKPS